MAIIIIAITPQLYRGYIYVPLGDNLCYYLGSRFYNPQLGRFLNADKHTDTGTGVNGTNMFAYCNNNPVIYIDPDGESLFPIFDFLSIFILLSSRMSYFVQAGNILRKLGYDTSNYSLHSAYMTSGGRYITLKYQTDNVKKKWSRERSFLNAYFEARAVYEWYDIIFNSVIKRIPLLNTIDDYCEDNPLYAEIMHVLFQNYVSEEIVFTWDFFKTILDFYYFEKKQSSPDSILFTKKERYVLNIINQLGYSADSSRIIMIANEIETYTKVWITFPIADYTKLYYSYCPYE